MCVCGWGPVEGPGDRCENSHSCTLLFPHRRSSDRANKCSLFLTAVSEAEENSGHVDDWTEPLPQSTALTFEGLSLTNLVVAAPVNLPGDSVCSRLIKTWCHEDRISDRWTQTTPLPLWAHSRCCLSLFFLSYWPISARCTTLLFWRPPSEHL